MIQSMMLRRKGCYDPKDLEGVLPVLGRCLYDGGDGGGVHIQGLAAHGADSGRIPALGSGDIVSLESRASRMPLPSARLLSGRLALGLRVRNAYGVLRRRRADVRAGLDDWPMTGLKFHNTSLQLFDFLFLPCNAAVKDIICANLLVKFSASTAESRSSEYPISRRSCLRRRVSFIRSDSRLFRSPVLKSFSIPHG